MIDLAYDEDVLQAERALVDVLQLAHAERLTVADCAQLRSLDARYRTPGDLVYVRSLGRNVRWVGGIHNPDDGQTCFQSAAWVDAQGAPRPGRFLLCTNMTPVKPRNLQHAIPACAVESGWARSVELYQGTADSRELFKRFAGRRPLLAIKYQGDNRRALTNASIYDVTLRFQILALSFHPRRGMEALEGSDIPKEGAKDPGLFRMLGEAENTLIGVSHPSTGYSHLCRGIISVQPKGRSILMESLSQRLFVGASELEVQCRIHRPDYVAVPMSALFAQKNHSMQGSAIADALIVEDDLSACTVEWPQTGLVAKVHGGSIRRNGILYTLPATTVQLPANRLISRYITSEGAWAFDSTDTPLPTDAGALLIGQTTTDASGVVFDEVKINVIRKESPAIDTGVIDVEEAHHPVG